MTTRSDRGTAGRAGVYLALSMTLAACTGLPDGIAPVHDFRLQPYLGTWYEIARLDHAFERGLQRVTASYTPREDGGIRVINRGFAVEQGEWQEAEGRAYFVGAPDVGHLKVSFFGPFYASYVVFELDEAYRYAFVTSDDRDYLWLLSRTPRVSDALEQHFVATARRLGFDTDALIFVRHD